MLGQLCTGKNDNREPHCLPSTLTSHLSPLSYGFGAPFVLEGALEESDPGCGTEELQQVLQKYPNLQNLSGSLYYTLESSLGAEDPYSLVEPRHLPTVKMFDLKVSSVIRPLLGLVFIIVL